MQSTSKIYGAFASTFTLGAEMNVFEAEDKYKELNDILARGDITRSTKTDLERFAVLLSRPGASTAFGGSQFPQACETVRLMLTVRMSEEQNLQARKESRLALIIACVALLAGILQTLVSVYQAWLSLPVAAQESPQSTQALVSKLPTKPKQSSPPIPK